MLMVPQATDARHTTQSDPPQLSLSHPSYTTLPISSSLPPSLQFSRPLPPTDPTSTRMPPPRVSPRPPPLRIARKKPPPTELMGPPSTIAQTSPPALNNVAFFPQSTTIHLPNTASTSTSISEGESSLTIPTPPLSDATSSPPLSSGRPPSVEDKSLLPNVQFGPRPARNSKRVSSSFLLEQRRGVEIPSAEEFGVPNSSFPVVSVPRPSQVSSRATH